MKRNDLLRALLAGFFVGNGLPHLINGAAQNSYFPCSIGTGPAQNAFAGVFSLSAVPFILGRHRRKRPALMWLAGCAIAAAATVGHARYGKVGPGAS